nr:terpene synthase [Ficus altissima]
MAANDTGLSAANNVARRRGYCDYPTIWNYDYIQSIKSEYAQGEGVYASQRDRLKDQVRLMLKEITDPLVQLDTIDVLERLGICYHFEDEIKSILEGTYNINDFESGIWKDNLYATALKFRLLRQHLYPVPQEIFLDFKDESGKLKFESIGNDVKGLLSLYEASFLLMPGENILEEAREFTSKHLQEFVKQNEDETYLSKLVGHALEVPLHWRVPRLEARWFIDLCKKSPEIINPTFLELSILDYNIVQSIHQEDLRQVSRWWRDLKFEENINFFRERTAETTLWNTGMIFDPQHSYCRKMESILYNLFVVLDDTYDTYGTVDELELLTTAFESWDMKAMDGLPDYMKLLFLGIYNHINGLAFDILKEKELHVIKYLKKVFVDVTKSYLQEAKWYYSAHIPTFHDYMENGWVSIGAIASLVIAFFVLESPITKEALEIFDAGYPSIIRQSSLIIRFANDLATDSFEKKKGDAPTSIECYMHETGVSEDEARRHVLSLMSEAWKQLNECRGTNSVFSRKYIEVITNLTRMSMWLYDGRDGFGIHNQGVTKDAVLSVFVNPISLDE